MSSSSRPRKALRSQLPLDPPPSAPRLRWGDQIGSSTERRATAATATAEPIAVATPSTRSSSAWSAPISSSQLSSDAAGPRPWWHYTLASAVASAVVSFGGFWWTTEEAAAEPTRASVRVIAYDPATVDEAPSPSLREVDPLVLADLGRDFARRGEHRTALPYLETAAARFPDDPQLRLELGDVHLALGRLEQARRNYAAAARAGLPAARARLRQLP